VSVTLLPLPGALKVTFCRYAPVRISESGIGGTTEELPGRTTTSLTLEG